MIYAIACYVGGILMGISIVEPSFDKIQAGSLGLCGTSLFVFGLHTIMKRLSEKCQ